MDLKILVYKTRKHFIDNKECFRETVSDVPQDFGYSDLVLALKSAFGDHCVIKFCII